ncbi:hypothetical protein [Jeotgalibacillus campisalis]|uniref:hypothetical protein n=1 Tax=Jeotgalibacillus campisalis TaxID=220754 RepID=UPI000596C2C0|nr:hypothetical protein [Jeotgalibacillus campisalis]
MQQVSFFYTYNYEDGNLTVENVENVILEMIEKYPDAKFKGMSWYDKHSDHKNTGIALKYLHDKGIVQDARFYLTSSQFGSVKTKGVIADKFNPQFTPFLAAGIESYNHWHPKSGMYVVGYTSVGKSFERLRANSFSYYHTPAYTR